MAEIKVNVMRHTPVCAREKSAYGKMQTEKTQALLVAPFNAIERKNRHYQGRTNLFLIPEIPREITIERIPTMACDIIEYESVVPLIALIDRIQASNDPWGVAIIRRDYLRPITNEAFTLSIKSIMQSAAEAHIFFVGERSMYVAWKGKQKAIYINLRGFVSTNLMRAGLSVEPPVMVAYIDPRIHAAALKTLLEAEKPNLANISDEKLFSDCPEDADPEDFQSTDQSASGLKASREQVALYQEARNQKPYRKQLHILVVEDMSFSQKLLCEILRGVRVRNNNESPVIDAVQGIQDGWKIFLKKAPDTAFIDLNLPDGSGHTLARAIKEIDPSSRVIIVTGNNCEEEIGVARQNNVDHFITKPYNKKQIIDCVEAYLESSRTQTKMNRHGTAY